MFRSIIVACAIAVPALGQSAERTPSPPGVGDPAPAISVEQTVDPRKRLPASGAIAGDAIKGKVVVVDFSTSWCAGCIISVPHFNALAEEFAGDDGVVFLTVTNESEAAAEEFRTRRSIRTPLARDDDGSMFEDYWVNGIPAVAVIGADGRIAALLRPQNLTAAVIRDIKAGKRVEAVEWPERIKRNWDVRWLERKAGAPEPVGVRVTRTEKAGGQSRTDPRTGELRASGLPARTLIAAALGVPMRNIEFTGEEPAGYFDSVAVPPDKSLATVRQLAQAAVEAELGVTIRREQTKAAGFLLKRLEGAAPLPPGEAGPGSARPGSIDLPKATMKRVAEMLGTFAGKTVGDATGLAGDYRIRLNWDPSGGGEALKAALKEAGLELVPGEVEVERVLVGPRA